MHLMLTVYHYSTNEMLCPEESNTVGHKINNKCQYIWVMNRF